MYDFLGFFLFPLIEIYKFFFSILYSLFNYSDISIIFLSIASSFLLLPLLKLAKVSEEKISEKILQVNTAVNALPSELRGEDKFIELERIYKQFSYHPIENIKMGASFFLILPFFIAAFLFFQENLILFKDSGLLIKDLSVSDKLLFGFNVIPILIFLVNFFDARYKYKHLRSMQNTYLLASLVICTLIYNMPLCMTLYWATNSISSFLGNFKS